MKNLVLSSLMTVLVSQAAGCIITTEDDPTVFCGDGYIDPGEACDDGNNTDNDGCSVCTVDSTVLAQWSLKQVATNQIITCPPSAQTATVFSQRVDANLAPVGNPKMDLFNCSDNQGRTAPLASDTWQVWVEFGGSGGAYARSLSAYLDLSTGDKTFTTTLLNDGGYFQFDWNLVNAANNAPLTCASAGADGVGAVSTLVANQSMFKDDKFTCSDGTGITGGLLAGTYTVSIDALEGNNSVSPAPVNLTNKVIGDKNQVTDLGVVTIPVSL